MLGGVKKVGWGCADGVGIAVCSEMVEVTHNDGGVGGGKVVVRW